MRFKTAAMLAGAAFLLAGAPMALAKTADHQFSGEVNHLDRPAKTLVVKGQDTEMGKEMTFRLAPDVKIMQASKTMTLGDLKVGEHVTVTYVDQGVTHQANRIEVLPPKISKAAPANRPASKSKY